MLLKSNLNNKETSDTCTDTEIWALFKASNKEAYALLYKRYFFILFKYGMKISPNRELVKDCIQDLFVELWKNKENLGNPESVRNYLFKSLRNKVVRKMSGRFNSLFNDELPDDYKSETISSHEIKLINDQIFVEKNNSLTNALNTLTKRQREAVFLIFYSNIPYSEASQIMSLSVDSVYNLISKAINILQKNIRKVSTSYLLFLTLFTHHL